MNAIRSGYGALISTAVFALALSLIGCATETVKGPREVEAMIAGAKSTSDHAGLAQWYDQRAKEDSERAEQHKKMAVGYQSWDSRLNGASLLIHCQKLARQYEEAANENKSLAKLHREIAANMKS